MQPLVSIITPAYNVTKYIDETIASVLAQDHVNTEHVIVDDASTDETAARVKQWMTISNRIKLIELTQNGGPGPAINSGVGASSGEYLAILAADDKLVPSYIMRCLQVLQKHSKVGFVYTDTTYFRAYDDDFVYKRVNAGSWNVSTLRQRNILGECTFVMRRSVFDTIGGYRGIPHSEDYDFLLACAGHGIIGMPLHNTTVNIRVRPNSRWASATPESILETDKMLRERHGHGIAPLYDRDPR